MTQATFEWVSILRACTLIIFQCYGIVAVTVIKAQSVWIPSIL